MSQGSRNGKEVIKMPRTTLHAVSNITGIISYCHSNWYYSNKMKSAGLPKMMLSPLY